MARLQEQVEGLDVWVALHGNESGHIESAAQMAIAGTADMGRLMHGGAGVVMDRIEAAVCDPLPHSHVLSQRSQLGQQLDGADLGDAGYGEQPVELLAQAGVGLIPALGQQPQ